MKKSLILLTIFTLVIGIHALPNSVDAQEAFIGEIKLFAGNFAPRGWAFCDGQLIPITDNDALFSILGTTYGGDGRTNFALPDLRGRVPVHPGSGPDLSTYYLGQKGGEESSTLSTNQIPTHNHDLIGSSSKASAKNPQGNLLGKSKKKIYSPGGAIVMMDTGAISEVGGGESHENRQPYLGVNYIIALQGLFPSRN